MHLIVPTGIIVLMLGLITLNSQVSTAKHEENISEDKKSDSNNDQASDTTTIPTDNKQTNSDIIPIPAETPTPPVAPTQCDEANAKPECANTVITPTPQVRSEQTQDRLQPSTKSDSSQTLTEKDSNNNGGGGSNSDNSGSDSSSNNAGDRQSNDNNLGSESHFIIMLQAKGIGLYSVVSDETELDTGILPQTIRLVQTFHDLADAISWLSDYDSRN